MHTIKDGATEGAALTSIPETNGTKSERKKKARVIPENPLGYRPLEFAALLGVGKTKAFSMIRDGEVESVLIGRTRIVKASSVQALLERAA